MKKKCKAASELSRRSWQIHWKSWTESVLIHQLLTLIYNYSSVPNISSVVFSCSRSISSTITVPILLEFKLDAMLFLFPFTNAPLSMQNYICKPTNLHCNCQRLKWGLQLFSETKRVLQTSSGCVHQSSTIALLNSKIPIAIHSSQHHFNDP